MDVKVISLNIWDGGKLLTAALDFLGQQDADVVLLQEVFNNTESDLPIIYRTYEALEVLDYAYSDFAPGFKYRFTDGDYLQGNAILSKFPIISSSSRFLVEPTQDVYEYIPESFPLVARVLQLAELDTPKGTVNIANVHGVWDLAGDSFSHARQKMLEIMLEETAGKPNVILAGDTNASLGNPMWQIFGKSFDPVFKDELKSTFNMRRKTKPGYAAAAVDLMFVSPNIKVVSKDCPDVDISDHLPIVADLKIT